VVEYTAAASDVGQAGAGRVDEDLGPLGGVGLRFETVKYRGLGAKVFERWVGLGCLLQEADYRRGHWFYGPFLKQRAQRGHSGLSSLGRVLLGLPEEVLGFLEAVEGLAHG